MAFTIGLAAGVAASAAGAAALTAITIGVLAAVGYDYVMESMMEDIKKIQCLVVM